MKIGYRRHECISMFIAALCTEKSYSAVRKKQIWQFPTKWVDLEGYYAKQNKSPRERQILYEESKIVKLIEAECRMVVARDWREMWRWWSRGTKFVMQDE